MLSPLPRFGPMDHLLNLIEHPRFSDRLILRLIFIVTIISGLIFIYNLNQHHVISTPSPGGTLSEGIIGIPRFVNPVLALTRADQDAVALIYNGLMKISPEGELIPDLAKSITLSEDGLTYEIEVRRDLRFHDGTPLTAHDVVFTLELIKDPDLKSPLRGNWNDALIEEIDEYRLRVTLNEPYYPFIENFTIGILPSHIWSTLPIEQLPFSQYNTEPIGSGPFAIKKVNRDNSGLINSYLLIPVTENNQKANLAGIELKFYQNETQLEAALSQKQIDATIFLPTAKMSQIDNTKYQVITTPLPRVFAIFISQNRTPALRDLAARQALSTAINREAMITKVLHGYGFPLTTPTIPTDHELQSTDTVLEDTVASAQEILVAGGWKRNEAGQWQKKVGDATETLMVTISTGNSPQYESTAETIAETWRSLGVDVQVEQYEQTGLVQSVIRTRDFQALLFGIDLNRSQDLYPFWHSSQKDDPALNIAQYTNVSVDRLLETARTRADSNVRAEEQAKAEAIISSEIPAIFLYAPTITYVIDRNIQPSEIQRIGRPSDRFMNINDWYAKTDSVWPIFSQN